MNLKSLYSGKNMDHYEKQAAACPDTLVCTDCGATRKHGKVRGSGWITFVLLLFWIVPGVIYSIWRHAGALLCQSCNGKLIAIASPRGRKMVIEAI